MYKKLLIITIVLIIILSGCDCKQSGSEYTVSQAVLSTQNSLITLQDSNSGFTSGQYVFYSTQDGLYRSNPDGSGKILLFSNSYTRLIGNIRGWVYYIDKDDLLYKVDENGLQKKVLANSEIADAVIMNNTVYYIQSGNLFSVDANDSVNQYMKLPQVILQLPYHLIADGDCLYICTYFELGQCNIYTCNLQNGQIELALKSVCDDPFMIDKGNVIQVTNTGQDNHIFQQDIITGDKQNITDFTGILFDMGIYQDWLIYITRSNNENKLYINGLNRKTGHTFQLLSQGDHIFQTLSSQVLIIDSENQAICRFIISNNDQYFDTFSEAD